ncbi:hypothetical protein [Leptobacterium sp. I13]|uniref:leucine-rich repeat domain-containing protein n=1 Tax=Leptobacterium meishanense TaxID=3128904 RepID=UPI0030EBC216
MNTHLLKTISILFLITGWVHLNAQRASRESYKYTYVNYPLVDVSNAYSYGIKIHQGGLPVSENHFTSNRARRKFREYTKDLTFYALDHFKYVEEDPDIWIEIAFGDFEVVEKAMKIHKIGCVYEGAKLNSVESIKKNLKECDGYYYEITYKVPYILKISNKSGQVFFIKEYDTNDVTTYGYDSTGLTGYLVKEELAAAFEESGMDKIYRDAIHEKVAEMLYDIYENVFFDKEIDEFKIGTAKDKDYDYAKLDEVQDNVIEALEENTPELETVLKEGIAIWESEVADADIGNNKARINRRVATTLYGNLTIAYMYLDDFEKATVYGKEYLKLTEIAFNQAIDDRAEVIWSRLKDREERRENNKSLIMNAPLVEAPDLVDIFNGKSVNGSYTLLTGLAMYSDFQEEINAINTERIAAIQAASEEKRNNPTEDDIVEKYRNRISYTALQGYVLFINNWYDRDIEGKELPEAIGTLKELNELRAYGLSLTAVPENIGSLTGLKRLDLSGNALTVLPASIGNLSQLEVLDLSDNQLTTLPEEIKNLANLKRVKLGKNNISSAEEKRIKALLPPKCKLKI